MRRYEHHVMIGRRKHSRNVAQDITRCRQKLIITNRSIRTNKQIIIIHVEQQFRFKIVIISSYLHQNCLIVSTSFLFIR